jgi:CBS domain containing-hemolysin-like protein
LNALEWELSYVAGYGFSHQYAAERHEKLLEQVSQTDLGSIIRHPAVRASLAGQKLLVFASDTLVSALRKLEASQQLAAPVVDDFGVLIGIVRRDDIVSAILLNLVSQ